MPDDSSPTSPSSNNPLGFKSHSTIHFEGLDPFEDDEPPSTWQTFSRKFKEQPLVPLGAGATTIALLGAGRAIQRGDSSTFNLWCRYRIVFQGLTLVAALGGSLYYNHERNAAEKLKEEERERQRIHQRDLRIQSQELNRQLPTSAGSESSPSPQPSLPQGSLFNHQNHQIRKALLDRKASDQHKSA